ncbi:hypothetical protein DITRI_Ditri01bG0177800 [Diplodiscus trichospermus]
MDQNSRASSSQGHHQSISFPSLENLCIFGCSNMKVLFPICIIPSLSNLKSFDIRGISKLEQVFGYQGEQSIEHYQKEIAFPELRSFKLSKLPGLKSFAPLGYHFHYPSLDYFEVTECPTLTTSSSMDPKTPAITEASQQVQNNTTEGFTTIKETAENQFTCNDIIWDIDECLEDLRYVTMGETKIIIREEVKKSEEPF